MRDQAESERMSRNGKPQTRGDVQLLKPVVVNGMAKPIKPRARIIDGELDVWGLACFIWLLRPAPKASTGS
jgi:hypothetical protein